MRIRPSGPVFGVVVALLIAISCLTANAQSGRRQTKPPAVAPVPTSTPEPTPKPTPKKDEDSQNFLVATGDRGARISRAPITFHEAATNGCAEQLRKRTSLDVDLAQREMTRGEAIAKAKAGKTTYVVLVSLIEDTMYAGSSGYTEFEVDYVVFAPGTAKVLASGRTYEGSTRKGPLVVGPRTRGVTLPTYREQALRRAGQDAADRILKSLHLNDPPRTK